VWICGTCINVISFLHLRKVSHPCTSFHGTHKSSAPLYAEFLHPLSLYPIKVTVSLWINVQLTGTVCLGQWLPMIRSTDKP